MTKKLNAPIRYFGGKGTMYNNIIEHIPLKGTYNTYIEPFGGSFSIGLKLEPVSIEIYNDLEENVYSLYKVISDKVLFNEFKEKCDLAIYSEQFRTEYKAKLKNDDLTIIDRAFYFFYVNRTSHNGIGGFSTNLSIRRNMSKSISDMLSTIDKLPEIHQRMSNVIISNNDGISLINKHNNVNTFIYCDPPYEQKTRTAARYSVDMNNNQHLLFIDEVLKSKSKILISGYECEEYNKLTENNFTKYQFEVKTIDGKFNKKTKIETLWKNYEN